MRANLVPSTHKNTIGKMILNCNNPFTPENDYEEMLLYYFVRFNNSLVDIEAATSGELDNGVVIQLCKMEATLSSKLDAVLEELRLMRQGRVI